MRRVKTQTDSYRIGGQIIFYMLEVQIELKMSVRISRMSLITAYKIL